MLKRDRKYFMNLSSWIRIFWKEELIQGWKPYEENVHISDNLDSEAVSMPGLAEHYCFFKIRRELYRKVPKNRLFELFRI